MFKKPILSIVQNHLCRIMRVWHIVTTIVATQDRVFPYYVPNSSIKHSKSDSKDRSQEIL
jgi:hypothetical protein